MINWRKGLFRLWIISAIFWIIGIGAFSFGEYRKAVKKESRIKLIVSETKNPEKALKQINIEFPESKQYGFIDMGPVDKSKEDLTKLSDEELLKSVNKSHKSDAVDSKSTLIPLDEFIQEILKNICKQAETNKIDKLYNIILLSIIPPIILLIIGSSIYWALRGFRA